MTRLRLEALEDRATPSTLPGGFTESILVSGLDNPTSLVVVPDGRLLITQQAGEVRIVQNGQLLATPALTLAVTSNGERGLLGAELDPNFAGNGFIYLYYTRATGDQHLVSRFTLSGNTINPASEVPIFAIPDSPATSNHNGGALHFGPDGKLYIAVGDDADGSNAQSLNNLHGKILRISAGGAIPSDNPFFATTSGDNRAIWAYGLRNPFTFAFGPGGAMNINDVGSSSMEEVDAGADGRNYGWPATEGSFNPATFPGFTNPIFAYPHASGTDGGVAITGGVFYPEAGGSFPADYAGDYFFADLANAWIRRRDASTGQAVLFATDTPLNTVDLDMQADGSLLVLSYTGVVTRMAFTAGPAPLPTPRLIGFPQFAVGGRNAATLFNAEKSTRFVVAPYEASFTGGVRVAASDFTGDGVADLVVASGPGRPGNVRVLDGVTQGVLFDFTPFTDAFTLGVLAAAGDITGDGKAELVLTAEDGGGARVRIFSPGAGGFTQLADFFALIGADGKADENFRGGGRAAVGDINGDGFGDLVFAAGTGGGPRIAAFNGKALGANGGPKLFADFFAFESTLRNGAYVAVGDFDADGFADLAAGAGLGGGPRVSVFSGSALLGSQPTRIRDFFAGQPEGRNGVRIAVKNLDGDNLADLVTGTAAGSGDRVTGYRGAVLNSSTTPAAAFDFSADGGASTGVFVG